MPLRSAPAQYLLRFDDFCPTMAKARRERFLAVIARYGIRPILAVVPANDDPDLKIEDPDPEFWARMRTLEAAGATIAMHGYRHLCESRGQSILGLHRDTEFAGVHEETQRKWIRTGLEILRGHQLCPRLFVAPRHGFDHTTLHALSKEGLRILSDGFASRPFTRGGIVWIPQQLWEPVRKSRGLWTICIHTNTATADLVGKLEAFLRENGKQFVAFDQVVSNFEPAELGWKERLTEILATRRVRSRSSGRNRALAM